jgi:hypothetical protein
VIHRVASPLKACVYARQSWSVRREGKVIARKDDLRLCWALLHKESWGESSPLHGILMKRLRLCRNQAYPVLPYG